MNQDWKLLRQQVTDALDRLEAWLVANPGKAPDDPVLCRALELFWLVGDAAAGDEPMESFDFESYRGLIELDMQLREQWGQVPSSVSRGAVP